jgi:uncharacterized integral membrane protein
MFRRRKPETAQEYLTLAERAFERERFQEAVRLCEEAIRLDPGDAEAYNGLASSLVMLDRLDEAIAAWERAIALAPGEPELAYSLGVAYEQKGLAEKAAAQFRRVLELEPEDEDARRKLGALGGENEAAKGSVRGRWSRLTPEETDAGERLARLRRSREKALGWLVIAFIAGVLILRRPLWAAAKAVVAGRPMLQSLDDVDRIFVGVFLAVVAGLAMAGLVATLRLRSAESRIRAEGLDVTEIDAYATEAEERLESEEREAEREEEKQWAEECGRAKVWWIRELSGAHLVWWIAFAVFGGQELKVFVVPEALANAVTMCAIFGGILKLLVTVLMFRSTYRMAVRYYRWWGRGWLPVVIAVLPGVLGYFAAKSGG